MSQITHPINSLSGDLAATLVAAGTEDALFLFICLTTCGYLGQPEPAIDQKDVLNAEITRMAESFVLLLKKGPAVEVLAKFAMQTAAQVLDHSGDAKDMIARFALSTPRS